MHPVIKFVEECFGGRKDSVRKLTLRLICNPQHNLSAGMMRRGLSLRRDRFTQRQNLRHDRLDLSRVDQARNLGEIFGIRMNGDGCCMNAAVPELGRIGARDQRHDDSAFLTTP